jgi:hypothetical protein
MAFATLIISDSLQTQPSKSTDNSEKRLDLGDKLFIEVSSNKSLSSREIVQQHSEMLPVAENILTDKELQEIANPDRLVRLLTATVGFLLFAVFFAGFGFLHPIFFVIGGTLLANAIYLGYKTIGEYREMKNAQAELTHRQQVFMEETLSEGSEIEKLVSGKCAKFEANGLFTSDKFNEMMNQNQDGALNAFSSYVQDLKYPYTIRGVKVEKNESTPDAIFRHFATQAGFDTPESVQAALRSDDQQIQNRARHLCGLLKLLGDENKPVNIDIVNDVFDEGAALDGVALKNGELSINCFKEQFGASSIMYMVEGDIVGVYEIGDMGKAQADRQPLNRYKTSRFVTVFPPDENGNVTYQINRTFKRI